MNYVPVDAGTNSTNLSGTKDAANQEVKKNESLRYIVLPNWAHDALLESTSSKPYEESRSQVPEGSRNPNSTASTFNPPVEQMETLTVESPIPTVSSPVPTASSPVPTACLHDSSEPSSSRNPNPTASISNPPADQMETLTVETPIPIVSLPVPTSYFTDSQEPSSNKRLISKRVANQEETQSLDNILTLTNRFEDILGVTTNSDESNVEN
nr:hypothetical protein [Tanacetum cinerariifolium]